MSTFVVLIRFLKSEKLFLNPDRMISDSVNTKIIGIVDKCKDNSLKWLDRICLDIIILLRHKSEDKTQMAYISKCIYSASHI